LAFQIRAAYTSPDIYLTLRASAQRRHQLTSLARLASGRRRRLVDIFARASPELAVGAFTEPNSATAPPVSAPLSWAVASSDGTAAIAPGSYSQCSCFFSPSNLFCACPSPLLTVTYGQGSLPGRVDVSNRPPLKALSQPRPKKSSELAPSSVPVRSGPSAGDQLGPLYWMSKGVPTSR